jgi:large subunit ribosomal protein L13
MQRNRMNRTKTYSLSAKDIDKAWHVLDATDQTLGRLSTSVAVLLMGKHKPTYSPHLDMGDFVIIVNAEKVRVTGKKLDDKIYYRHTGYMGGLKETTLSDMLARNPRRVIELSVRGMLPRNRLSRQLLGHLKVYAGPVHPHEAQVNASRKGRDSRGALRPSVARRRHVTPLGWPAASEEAGVSAKDKRGSKAVPRASTVGPGGETKRSRKTAAAKTGETKTKRTGARTSKESKA